MAQQTLNDGVSFGEQRSKINSNFTELYSTKTTNSDTVITPGGYAVDITGTDLNTAYRTGFFGGYGLVHAPLDNGGWWHVLIASVDANWVKQTATSFGSGNTAGDTYERVCSGGSWTSWAKVFKGTDVYPVAGSLGSGASINGKVFSGLENIRVAESIHSVRDCTLGTLIETSIDYTGFSGDPFLLRITGNSYSRLIPVDISVQGYIHNSSIFQYGGISTGSVISGLVALLYNGHLCFWFPYQTYWEGYDVSVITALPDKNVNKVISIQNAAMPAGAQRVVELSSHIRQAMTLDASGSLTPGSNGAGKLGTTSLRWGELWVTTGAFNTSDARQKTEVIDFSPDEIKAAKMLSKEIGIYKWLKSVEDKGDSARNHIGLTVQRAIAILEECNLDPWSYAFIAYDKWDDEFVNHPAIEAVQAKDAVLDEDGNVLEPAIEAIEAKDAWVEKVKEAGDAYAFRYDQLNLFIARGIEARLSAIEAKLN